MTQLLVNIDVEDLARATTFYCDAFGLRIARRFGDGAVELLGAAAPIYLLAKPAGSAASDASASKRDYRRHWTPVHLDFVVEDLDAAIARVVTAGASAEGGIRRNVWGDIAQFADPFGNGFCLLAFRGAGYDEIAAGTA
jgi:predicted enzyme related to lactoylglutathione lyase